MDEDIAIQILWLRRRIAELETRLKHPKHWSSGELDIFRRQVRKDRQTLNHFLNPDN